MKRIVYALLMIALLIVALSLNSCGGCRHYAQSGAPVVWATCTEGGYGEMYCAECGKLVETYPIDPLGHKYVNKVVESTCSDMGYIAQVCERCEDQKNIQYLELLPHTEEIIPGVESTCTEHGLTEGKVCSVCDKILVSQEEAPLKAHEYDDNNDAVCNNCGYERYCVHRNTVILEAKEPTCTSTGLTAGKKCEDCEEILTEQEIVPMLEHNYEFVTVVDATCEIQGYTKHACACGAFYNDNFVDALMHDYGSWYMYRDETTPIEGEGRRDCQRENCEHYDTHVASSGFTYTVNSDQMTCVLTGIGTCSDTELFLPFSIDGYRVTSIGNNVFKNCKLIVSVTIPNTVRKLGSSIFEGCTSLVSVEIGDLVTSIPYQAFYNCTSLTRIKIPDSVTMIDIYAFRDCTSLESIEIPDSVTRISTSAFGNCKSLTSIVMGDSVISIGDDVFNGCKSLTTIEIPDLVTSIGERAFCGCTSLASIDMSDSVTSVGDNAFYGCSSLSEVYYRGDVEGWLGITFANSSANPMHYNANLYFNNELVTDIEIPNSATSISANSFFNCKSLISIKIGNSVISIGERAFCGCTSLTSIDMSDSVTNIDISAFSGCTSLSSVVIPDSMTVIGKAAFLDCSSLMNVKFGNNTQLEIIGDRAFENCDSLTNIVIPDSVVSIGDRAFGSCASLTSIVVDEDNEYYKSIDGNLYSKDGKILMQYSIGKQNTYFNIPDGVTSIGNEAFSHCLSLISVVMPNSITTIGEESFYCCTSLTNVDIPDSVTKIDKSAFNACSSITRIKIPNSVTSVGDYAFAYCKRAHIYCEAESKPDGWSDSWSYFSGPVIWGYKDE